MRNYLAILVPLLLAAGAVRAEPDQLPACGASTVALQQCACAIEQLRPTQVSVGWLHVRDILENPRPSFSRMPNASRPRSWWAPAEPST